MNKKTTFYILVFVLIGIVLYYLIFIQGWMRFRENTDTPREYLSVVVPTREAYQHDRIFLEHEIKQHILGQRDLFADHTYSGGTEIIIDTILYDPSYEKMAILVIAKTSTEKQLIPDQGHDWFYDATCYLGIREKDSIKLSWTGPNFTNATHQSDISKLIREACLRNFVEKDSTGNFDYNMNDKRFWNSNIWRRFEQEERKKKAFELEKQLHPENVYEPKKDSASSQTDTSR